MFINAGNRLLSSDPGVAGSFILYTALLFLGGFGFIFQFVGLISLTQSNFLLIVAFVLLAFLNRDRFFHLLKTRITLCFLLFILFVQPVVSFFATKSDIISLVVYYYYNFTIIVGLFLGYLFSLSFNTGRRKVSRLLVLVVFVQLAMTFIQFWLSDLFVALSKVPLNKEDVVSGTFFLKSDASMMFSLNVIMFIVFMLRLPLATKYLCLFAVLGVSYLSGSKFLAFATHLNVIFLVCRNLIPALSIRPVFSFWVISFLIFIVTVVAVSYSHEIKVFFDDIFFEIYHARFASYGAHRLAGLGEFLYGEVPFFGNGLLTYYNPLTSDWLYYAGHSTIYSAYLDMGISGIVTLFLFFGFLIFSMNVGLVQKILLVVMLIGFCFFNFILTDLAVLISLFTLYFLAEKIKYKRV